MDCLAGLDTQWKLLTNVTQANMIMATVTDLCPIIYYTFLDWLLIILFWPFFVPALLIAIHLAISIYAHIYRYWHGLGNTSTDNKAWGHVKRLMAVVYRFCGRVLHGYEIEGLENIPAEGPCLLVVYHGPSFYDFVYMASEIYLGRNRLMGSVVHRFTLSIPGMQLLFRVFKAFPGTRETFTKALKDGNLIMIAPGGAYEALYSDNYQLLWRNRIGYAKVAIEAQCPIIPVFTVNIRELTKSIIFGKKLRNMLYEKWRILLTFYIGWFPVKLRTIVGEPIAFDPALTAEELDRKVTMSMEQLIKDNQRLPGSISMALMDRFKCPKRLKMN